MLKCEFCGGDTVEIPDFEGAECYGEFHHICKRCGAVGQEIFGHGIRWSKKGNCKYSSYCNNHNCNKCVLEAIV